MTPRVYLPQPLHEQQRAVLDDRARHYLVNVLRLKDAAPVIIFNGDGHDYRGTLRMAQRKSAWVDLGSRTPVDNESTLSLHLAQVVSRGERMDLTIQKAVELGVATIIPLLSTRCEVRLSPQRWHKRLDHWRQIIISACEQCGRSRLPAISLPVPLHTWLNTSTMTDEKDAASLVLNPGQGAPLARAVPTRPASCTLVVGPEGGLTAEELAGCEQAGFRSVRLGPRILRTETAAMAALAALQALYGDFAAP